MSETTIAWTDAVWNPATGCAPVGPGCDNCYAREVAVSARMAKYYPRGFDLMLRPERLDAPLHWKKPRMVFVNSMSDLFHEGIQDDYISKVFDVMERAGRHTFQALTKRAPRMCRYVAARYARAVPPANIWLGVSVESRAQIGRIDWLRRTPAAVRFVSFEPLLGDPGEIDLDGIHWVIVGGESGLHRRPFDVAWARSLHDQCRTAGVPFFMKQDAALHPGRQGLIPHYLWACKEYPA